LNAFSGVDVHSDPKEAAGCDMLGPGNDNPTELASKQKRHSVESGVFV
jgi:hypothetical protein